VPVLTCAPRSACAVTVGPSTVGQPQPATWAAGIAGGSTTVRGRAAPDGGEVASVPSGWTTVIVTVYCRAGSSVQPSAVPNPRQNVRGVWQRDRPVRSSVTDRCSTPDSTSVTVAHHCANAVGSPSGISALKYTISEVSPSRNPGRSSRSLAVLVAVACAFTAVARAAFCAAVGLYAAPPASTAGGSTGARWPLGKPWLGVADAGSGRLTGPAPAGATGVACAARVASGVATSRVAERIVIAA
jgi:hypothetical protein